MAYSILEQVKIRLKQFHIESVENSDTVVFDSKEDNPLLEQLIDQVKQEIVSRKMSGVPPMASDSFIFTPLFF